MPLNWLIGISKFSQVEVGDALLEDTNEEVVGELILVGKAGDGDGIKAAQESMSVSLR